VTFWTFLTVVEVVWVVAISLTILLERRSPVATLAWIFVLAWIPILGIVVYYFFGPRRLRRRKLKRQEGARLVARAVRELDASVDDARWTGLAKLAVATGESPPLPARDVTLYLEGDEKFDALVEAIGRARHHVHVEYYIFEDDPIGRRVVDALVERAKAGVEVRVVLDGIGSYALADSVLAPIERAGGQVAWFNPVSGFRPRWANFRTHRKILICDGTIALTGGINVSKDQSIAASGDKAWRDTHLRFEGPAVRALQRVFLEDWYFATGRMPPTGEAYFPRVPTTTLDAGDHALAQVISSGPDRDLYAIHQFFFGAITQAQSRLWLTTPYFVPDETTLAALVAAGLKGVDVRVLVPRSSDNLLVDLAARSYYPDLVRAGVKVHEYSGRMLHAKTLVVDDKLAVVGTANFDNRSFRLNFEVVVAVYDERTTSRLATAFEADLERAPLVKVRELKDKRLVERLGEAGARLFSPLL
jgi:cardiolipin synthase